MLCMHVDVSTKLPIILQRRGKVPNAEEEAKEVPAGRKEEIVNNPQEGMNARVTPTFNFARHRPKHFFFFFSHLQTAPRLKSRSKRD